MGELPQSNYKMTAAHLRRMKAPVKRGAEGLQLDRRQKIQLVWNFIGELEEGGDTQTIER